MKVDFWFDYASPFAYLAATQVPGLVARSGAEVRWRPMLLGALFRAVGQVDVPLASFSDAKQRWVLRDLQEWAEWWQVPFRFNPHFPVRTVLPLRVTLGHPDPADFARRVFHATWAEGLNPAEPGVLVDLGAPAELVRDAERWKPALFANTQEAEARGVFGTPTFDVEGRWLFWGQDRLDQLEDVLTGRWSPPA